MEATVTAVAPRGSAVRTPLIELERVEKVFRTGKLEYPALRGLDLEIEEGEMVAIVGPSGSGKSTLLNMVTGIDRPTAGTVTVDGRRLNDLSEEQLAVWRGANVGIVFQFFQLLPTLTALENATLPLDFAHRGSRRERARRPGATSTSSASPTRPTICRRSSPAASSSAWPSRARSRPTRS